MTKMLMTHSRRHPLNPNGYDHYGQLADSYIQGTGNLVSNLNADLWDGYHRTDDQTIGGVLNVGSSLKISGTEVINSSLEGYFTNLVNKAKGTADDTTTTYDSYQHILRGSYWDGSAAQNYDVALQHVMLNATPTSKLSILFNGVEKAWITNYGNMTLEGSLTIKGNKILDSGGTTRITLGSPILIGANLKFVEAATDDPYDIIFPNTNYGEGRIWYYKGNMYFRTNGSTAFLLNASQEGIFYKNARINPQGNADSTTTTYDSYLLKLRGTYWDGNATQNYEISLQNVMIDTTPSSKLSFLFAGTEKAYIDNSGNFWIAGSVVSNINMASGKQIVFPNENLEYKIQFANLCGISIRPDQEVVWLLKSDLPGHWKIVKTDGTTETTLLDLDKSGNLNVTGDLQVGEYLQSAKGIKDSDGTIFAWTYNYNTEYALTLRNPQGDSYDVLRIRNAADSVTVFKVSGNGNLTTTGVTYCDYFSVNNTAVKVRNDDPTVVMPILDNLLAFRSPYKVEVWDGSAWVDKTTATTWAYLTDCKSTGIAMSNYTYNTDYFKVRLYYNLGGKWQSPATMLYIVCQHLPYIDYVKVEHADDADITTNVSTLAEDSTTHSVGDGVLRVKTYVAYRQYLRIEIDGHRPSGGTQDMTIRDILYMALPFYSASRYAGSMIPIDWDYNKNIIVSGNLTVKKSGDTYLYLNNTSGKEYGIYAGGSGLGFKNITDNVQEMVLFSGGRLWISGMYDTDIGANWTDVGWHCGLRIPIAAAIGTKTSTSDGNYLGFGMTSGGFYWFKTTSAPGDTANPPTYLARLVEDTGNFWILGDLQVKGNDILDSGGTTRITLGSTITLNGDIKIAGNDIYDSGGTKRITIGSTNYIYGALQVSSNIQTPRSDTIRWKLIGPTSTSSATEKNSPYLDFICTYWDPVDEKSVDDTFTFRAIGSQSAPYLALLFNGATKFKFQYDGTGYADTGWQTFSPDIYNKSMLELIQINAREFTKPKTPRDEKGNRIPDEDGLDPDSIEYAERYGKDISKVALSSGKLLNMLIALLIKKGIISVEELMRYGKAS